MTLHASELLPPSHLTAITDQDGRVPLFWFKPNPDTSELTYDDDSADHRMYVSTEWHHNCLAVKMSSPEVPFYLFKSKVFITYEGADIDSNYDYQAPFFVTVNQDSGGIPRNACLDSALAWAADGDTIGCDGQWVEIEHDLLIIDTCDFWIVFHWLEGSPTSPTVGGDNSTNQRRSFWGMKNSPHFEWHLCSDFNIMIRAVVALNQETPLEVDSFRIYRSSTPGVPISVDNLVVSVPSDRFGYTDTNVINDQDYFYRVTSLYSDDESEGSNETWAVPKEAAVLIADQDSFLLHLGSEETVCKELILTNSGGLPLRFDIQIDMEEDSTWMGGCDEFGYTWTDKNLQGLFSYSWVDIGYFGQEIGKSGDNDENYGFFRMNFPFPFYGKSFDSLCISANGWISLTDPMDSVPASYVNKPVPWIWGPYNLIAPFWDDLIFSESSKIYFYSNDSDSAIISFINLAHYGSGGPYTFQAILNKNGEIVFQYEKTGDSPNSATVGIQNEDGTTGLEVIWNEDYLEDSSWVKITPSWISVDSRTGIIQPNQSKTLNLAFDRLSYPQGIYHANLVVKSWDKNHELDPVEIPLTLCIDTTTSVDLEEEQKPVSFALFQNYPNPFNPATIIRFSIQSSEFKAPVHTTLKIYNILGQKVRTLIDKPKRKGSYDVIWDGKDDRGNNVASGIYFYQLTAGDYRKTKKMTSVK